MRRSSLLCIIVCSIKHFFLSAFVVVFGEDHKNAARESRSNSCCCMLRLRFQVSFFLFLWRPSTKFSVDVKSTTLGTHTENSLDTRLHYRVAGTEERKYGRKGITFASAVHQKSPCRSILFYKIDKISFRVGCH